MPTFPCDYCSARLTSQKGLRSHIQQTRACRQKQNARYLDVESSESDADPDEAEPPSTAAASPAAYSDVPMDVGDEEINADPPFNEPLAEDTPPSEPDPLESANPRPPKRRRPTVEEVEDEDDIWVQDFPAKSEAGKVYGVCETQFEKILREQKETGQAPWNPCQSEEEWDLLRWLMTSGVSQSKRDEFLKLRVIREGCKPSFSNNRAFLKFVDALPRGPAWHCHLMELTGDEIDEKGDKKKEVVELWYRDPIDCVRELLGNPAFRGKQGFAPRRVFMSSGKRNREYTEMWTAKWWWEIQKLLPPGATLGPIIVASDKTQLTRFSGDQQAWPVYITVGNIDSETRRAPSYHATVLLGYIPVTKLEIFDKKNRSAVAHQLFHDCMRHILAPLAAYIADYPEQCLVACCRENSCPRCLVAPGARGDTADAPWRNPTDTVRIISEQAHGTRPPEFITQNLRPINPFWSDLPHCDIFTCFTPDLLHEIHNGIFGDHLVSWCSNAFRDGTGEAEIDSRFRAMTPHSSLRHFKKGISLTSQWTGNEHKNMEKVFLGIIANATDPAVVRAAKGAMDFIYYAHFETHCDESLSQMDAAWAAFHDNKQIFIDSGIRQNFDINKLHKLKHYTDSIRSHGTAPGFNTESTERLHIDLAKVGYKATNRKAYIKQMATWLRRQESVHKFGAYLRWAVPGYTPKYVPENDTEDIGGDEDEADDDDDADEHLPTSNYALPKKPHFPNLTAASISTNFHAPDFFAQPYGFPSFTANHPACRTNGGLHFPSLQAFRTDTSCDPGGNTTRFSG
ncbi:hypothetical protein MSAN_01133800 [Mycena sanguinolenta]|uniref:C2H2-type domain-containing protein n=1 Tax=Mycena sanguinolenta TaxID=230812 RepID=A0A8H6YL56_9AGAR|nr:hypothetical protein MSAN_01133800 [Mycena sanguinolenta]